MSHEFTYFSTFSGIGGFELALSNRRPKARCVGYSEIDQHAQRIYQRHFPKHINHGDVRTIDPAQLPKFDLLVGGFPCQTFSSAGGRGGFRDPRGTLFFEITRIARETQSRLLLLENVKGLLSHDKGATFAAVISALDELGYDCQWQVLNSQHYAVPQNRQRVFIVGHLRGTRRPEVFPLRPSVTQLRCKPIPKCTRKSVRSVWTVRDSACARQSILRSHSIRQLTPTEYERLQGFPDGWTSGISDAQRYKCLGNAVTVPVVEHIIEKLLK